MVEYIIISLLIILALGIITWRIKRIISGDNACSGCANDCNQCGIIHTTIQDEHEV